MKQLSKKKSVRHPHAGRFFVSTILAFAFVGCTPKPELVSFYGLAQGTNYSVQYYDQQYRNFQPQIDSLLDLFDQEASLWVENSLIRRINCNETDTLSPILADLFDKSIYINQYTGGAFDCRVGRIVQAWGFSFVSQESLDDDRLAKLLQSAQAPIQVIYPRIVKSDPTTEFDFNAIAQGYSSDLIAAFLDSMDIHDYLIDIGGEVVAHGLKPNGRSWIVGIERPAPDKNSEQIVELSITLDDRAAVTSGNYRKYYERDGVKYSHTINPSTGRPVQHSLLSVTVVDSTAWLADAMATAYMVMGLDSALSFIQHHPFGPGTDAVLFIYDQAGEMKSFATPSFQSLVKQQFPL